jgi:hypothetical protein
MQQSLSITQSLHESQESGKRKGLDETLLTPTEPACLANKMGRGRGLHKEWCNKKIVVHSLEIDLVFRATIKPAYQRRNSIHLDRTLAYVVVSSSQWV